MGNIVTAFRTSNLELAATLYTLGIPQFPEIPVLHEHSTGRDVTVWCFNDKTPGANRMTAEAIAAVWEWQKFKEWETDHTEDPLAYMRIGMHNRERLLDQAKQGKQLHVVSRGAKTFLVTI